MRRLLRVALLALAVGLVLADSSVVTLGLPAVLGDFDASPTGVSWVLTAYNLVLAVAALPAARLVRTSGAGRVAAVGLLVFAAASLVCAIAPSLGVLIAARCVQGLGGAAVACAALPLLAAGDRRRGIVIWGAAGAFGAAVGPAVGGVLTDLLSWEAIFAVQVPIALACLLGVRGGAGEAQPGARASVARLWEADEPGAASSREAHAPGAAAAVVPADATGGAPRASAGAAAEAAADRPEPRSLVALAFLGAGLTAALFLLVLMLIAGWRHDPITAAAAVSFMPLAALVANRLVAGLDTRTRGAAGAILVAGGLAALGLLPSASLAWTVAPQVFIGIGLGLSLGPLTEHALHGREPLALHGGWTIAARHAGVVAALALLTPVFVADLEQQDDRAQESVLAKILDSEIQPTTKLSLGLELAGDLDAADGEVPDPKPSFDAARPTDPTELAAYERLEDAVDEELDRAATTAFERSFLIAAALAALALLPLLVPKRIVAVAAAALAAGALVAVHQAADGGDFEPSPLADPCGRETRSAAEGLAGTAERIGLTALDSAACDLRVSREHLLLAVGGEETLDAGEDERNDAFRNGFREAIDQEERAGRLGGTEAALLRAGIEFLPVDALLDRVFSR